MLQEIERDPPVGIQGNNLAVYEGTGWKPFTSTGDMRELLCEKVFSPGPKGYPARIPASKTAVAVEFDLVEPFVALGKLLNRHAYIGSTK